MTTTNQNRMPSHRWIERGGQLIVRIDFSYVLPPALNPLLEKTHWIIWRLINGKKLPFQPRIPGQLAKSNDPSTWGSYDEAVAAVRKLSTPTRRWGLGFMLKGSGIAAFDLDDCRDPDTGMLEPWARQLVREANSYTEVTPSGSGIRIIGFASSREVHKQIAQSVGKLEIYRNTHRYITITGDEI